MCLFSANWDTVTSSFSFRKIDIGISDLAHLKSLKKFDWRVYFWYTHKQVSTVNLQDDETSKLKFVREKTVRRY